MMEDVQSVADAEAYLRSRLQGPGLHTDTRGCQTLSTELTEEFELCTPEVQAFVRAAVMEVLGELADLNSEWYATGADPDSAVDDLLLFARPEGGVIDIDHRPETLELLGAIQNQGRSVRGRVVGTIIANLGDDEASREFVETYRDRYPIEELVEMAGNLSNALHMVEALYGPDAALQIAKREHQAGGVNVPLLLKFAIAASHQKVEWRALLRVIAMTGSKSGTDPVLVTAIQEALGDKQGDNDVR